MGLRINQSDVRADTPSPAELTPFVPPADADHTGRLGIALVVFGIVALLGAVAALVVVR